MTATSSTKKPVKKATPPVIAPPVVVPPEDAKELYRIEIQFVDGQEFLGEGETMFDALAALERPIKVMSKGFIKATHAGMVKELFLMPKQMKRFFYPLGRSTTAKILEMHMKPAK